MGLSNRNKTSGRVGEAFLAHHVDVAASARAAGFTGEVAVGPASLEALTEVFDQNEFITSAKARRVLGWPGSPVHMELYYQGWKAGQMLEGTAFPRGY